MAGFRVEYSELAAESLIKLQRYIARKLLNPDAAIRQTDRIMSACESLSIFPRMHRVRKTDSKGRQLRFFPVDNYTIVYSIDDENHTVNILHVIYSRRDIDSMFQP